MTGHDILCDCYECMGGEPNPHGGIVHHDNFCVTHNMEMTWSAPCKRYLCKVCTKQHYAAYQRKRRARLRVTGSTVHQRGTCERDC